MGSGSIPEPVWVQRKFWYGFRINSRAGTVFRDKYRVKIDSRLLDRDQLHDRYGVRINSRARVGSWLIQTTGWDQLQHQYEFCKISESTWVREPNAFYAHVFLKYYSKSLANTHKKLTTRWTHVVTLQFFMPTIYAHTFWIERQQERGRKNSRSRDKHQTATTGGCSLSIAITITTILPTT